VKNSAICTEARLVDLVDRCSLLPYSELLIEKEVEPTRVKGTDEKGQNLSVMRTVVNGALGFVLFKSVKA
jgi:hypothetical protein